MRGSHQIFEDRRLIVLTIIGKPTLREMRLLYARCMLDPAFQPFYDGVVDLRRVVSNLSRREVKTLAAEVVKQRMTHGLWVALVHTPMPTALAQVYQRAVSRQHRLRVCSTVEKASQILGIDLAPYLHP